MWKRLSRGLLAAPRVTVGGTIALLMGLTWDVVLHQRDGSLAAREGVLTLANPGHALFVAGLGLSSAGTVLFLIQRLVAGHGQATGQRLVLRLGLIAVMALVAVSVGASAWSSRSVGVGHSDAAAARLTDRCAESLSTRSGPEAGAAHRHGPTAPHVRSHHGIVGSPDSISAAQACTAAAHHD